jgi:hypothetical protein
VWIARASAGLRRPLSKVNERVEWWWKGPSDECSLALQTTRPQVLGDVCKHARHAVQLGMSEIKVVASDAWVAGRGEETEHHRTRARLARHALHQLLRGGACAARRGLATQAVVKAVDAIRGGQASRKLHGRLHVGADLDHTLQIAAVVESERDLQQRLIMLRRSPTGRG